MKSTFCTHRVNEIDTQDCESFTGRYSELQSHHSAKPPIMAPAQSAFVPSLMPRTVMFKPYLELPRSIYILCAGTLIKSRRHVSRLISRSISEKVARLQRRLSHLTMGVFGLGSIVAALVGGHLADRIGRRTVMVCRARWAAPRRFSCPSAALTSLRQRLSSPPSSSSPSSATCTAPPPRP